MRRFVVRAGRFVTLLAVLGLGALLPRVAHAQG